MRSKLFKSLVAGALVIAFLASILMPMARQVDAASPTPQSFNASRAQAGLVVWANARTITADTRWCMDTHNYNGADIQWVIDQGTTNSTTLKLQFTNEDSGNASRRFFDGATLVSSNTVDANALNRQLLYGRYTCVLADVTNSNPIVITVIGVAK